MRERHVRHSILSLVLLSSSSVLALDPPHDATNAIECSSCHTPHTAPGGAITTVAGNSNLCLSCHAPGGPAAAKAFNDVDQAFPGPGLPAGEVAAGTSHRWDSGPSGHIEPVAGNTSSGAVQSTGTFTGRYAKTYTLTITTSGSVGTARFSWTATTPGGGSGANVLTAASVVLDEGLSVSFANGTSGTSFVTGDRFRLYVRTDLAQPSNTALATRLENGKTLCSTCHNQHSQIEPPFDPAAPAFGGAGTGAGRHFQRVANDAEAMCLDCHASRNVLSSTQGSHPVGVAVPVAGDFGAPTQLPLDAAGEVACLTCHTPHYTPSSDGSLRRLASMNALCTDCHKLADTATPAKHFETTAAATLWPGGQYGSAFPAVTDTTRRGTCVNCHQPHGWPDAANLSQDYPRLLVDREENLCYTCHDGSPVTANVRGEFSKTYRHPVTSTSGVHTPEEAVLAVTRHVECMDCHNTHTARQRVNLPGPSTTPRPASGPLTGARGITTTGAVAATAAFEYQVCFRCHSDNTGMPAAPTVRQFPQTNKRLEFAGTYPSFHPVAVVGRNTNVPSLIGGWTATSILACTSCHNNNAGPGNAGAGPNGPHGSTNPFLLERAYVKADNTPFTLAAYAMCFKCHSWDSLRSGNTFKEHDKHVRGENTPCNVCHDPHASSGNPKLINFDTVVVRPFNGRLEYRSTGTSRGECTLACHGQNHDRETYQP